MKRLNSWCRCVAVCVLFVTFLASASALDLLYDFEGDQAPTATDKLTDDGSQDGTMINTVSVTDEGAPFGDDAALFGPPPDPPRDELFSTLEIPGTLELGSSFTLAAFVNYSNTGFTRLFSSYGGTGAVGEGRIIFDFDPSGGLVNGLRFIVGPDGATSTTVPPELSDEGWKHIAVTFEDGEIAMYLNGIEVPMDNNIFSTLDVVSPVLLRFGEDPHDVGGAADEQFEGNVDDILVLGRALSAEEILAVAAAGVDGNVTPAGELAIYYDFEPPDSGTSITDRFDSDGAQNGVAVNNVAVDPSVQHPLFGTQSLRLSPKQPPELFSTIEIPGTMDLGAEWSVAAFVNYTNTGFTRFFSSFQGTGPPAPNRMILDFDPTGSVINGLRVIVGPEIVQALSVPAELSDPGWKHIALTFESGEIAVYLNGVDVPMERQLLTVTDSFAPVNLRFGEDPHDGGGTADEQFKGNVDDLLVLGRALTPGEIDVIAASGVAGNVEPAGELAVYYDFEPDDIGTTITDRFTSDGSQDGIFHNNGQIDPDESHPLFGTQSAKLDSPMAGPEVIPFSIIEVGPVGNLGEQFTLAATINVPGGGHPFDGLTRLFSTFGGTGSPAGRIIFDFDPNASVEGIGMRLLLPDGTALISGVTFSINEDHHLAAVYDEGDIRMYLDGALVAEGVSGGGPVDLGDFPLRIGEDVGGILNENFIGIMDEVLVLSRAMSASEIQSLAENGFGAPPMGQKFVRGDPNADGTRNIADGIFVLNFLFGGGTPPTCLESADVNGDGQRNIADGVYELNFLFGGGPPPPAPFPTCGVQEGADCASFEPCA